MKTDALTAAKRTRSNILKRLVKLMNQYRELEVVFRNIEKQIEELESESDAPAMR